VLDLQTGALQNLRVLKYVERVDRVYAVQFSPDSTTLAIGGFDGKVAFTSVSSLLSDEASPSLVEVSRSGLIFCLDWSPDGSFLAIGGSDKYCAIVDNSYELVHETQRSTSVETVKWNHDGTYLAIGDREVAILEAGTFDIKCEISNTPTASDASASKYRISSLCWSPDGTFLAVGGSDGICLVVETKGYALVHEVRRVGSIMCLAWGQRRLTNGDSRRYLAIGDESDTVALLKAGTELDGSASESDDVSSAASSSYFSTGSDWVLREDCFQDIDDAKPELPRGITPQGTITSVAFSRSLKSRTSPYLAYAADDCSLTIMTTRDWKAVFVSGGIASISLKSNFYFANIVSLALSANGVRQAYPHAHVFRVQQLPCAWRR
jgi:WD40 repeat protein